MNRFRLGCTCPVCDEQILGDAVVDFSAPDGVVNLDMFGSQCFECERCGTKVYTSSDILEMADIEEGEEPDDIDCYLEEDESDEDEDEY